MIQHNPYQPYKHSETNWFETIPHTWISGPLKRQLARNDGGVWGEDPTGEEGTLILRSTEQTVDGEWSIKSPAIRLISRAEQRRFALKRDDLVVTKSSGSADHIGKTTLVTEDIEAMGAAYSNFMQRLRLKPHHIAKYYWYVLRSNEVRQQINLLSTTTTGLANLTGTVIGNLTVPIPPKAEQLRIAGFLDQEIAEIRAFIGEQEVLINLLNERRSATITHAVTHGIDSGAAMREGNIEWLGQVPASWSVSKLGFLTTKIGSGKTPRGGAETYVKEGVMFLRSQNVHNTGLQLEDVVYINPDTDREMASTRVSRGDILLNITGASLGRTCLVPDDAEAMNVNQHVCIIRMKNPRHRRFIAYALKSQASRGQMQVLQNGSGREGLNFQQVSRIQVAYPSAPEQDRISNYLDHETAEIDAAIAEAREAIDLSRERRAALISAAVTGKIDVRNWRGSMERALESHGVA